LIGVDLKQLRRKADRRRDRRLEVSKRSIKPVAWAAVHDVTSECRTAWASWRPDLVEALTSGSSVVDLICSMMTSTTRHGGRRPYVHALGGVPHPTQPPNIQYSIDISTTKILP
jgi:hypothetical protein